MVDLIRRANGGSLNFSKSIWILARFICGIGISRGVSINVGFVVSLAKPTTDTLCIINLKPIRFPTDRKKFHAKTLNLQRVFYCQHNTIAPLQTVCYNVNINLIGLFYD